MSDAISERKSGPIYGPTSEETVAMKMDGKIIQKGKCHFCPGEYVVLQPTGETGTRVLHKEPLCEVFDKSNADDYIKFHGMNRHSRRAAAVQMRKQAEARQKKEVADAAEKSE